jgi:hypothetical protein
MSSTRSTRSTTVEGKFRIELDEVYSFIMNMFRRSCYDALLTTHNAQAARISELAEQAADKYAAWYAVHQELRQAHKHAVDSWYEVRTSSRTFDEGLKGTVSRLCKADTPKTC